MQDQDRQDLMQTPVDEPVNEPTQPPINEPAQPPVSQQPINYSTPHYYVQPPKPAGYNRGVGALICGVVALVCACTVILWPIALVCGIVSVVLAIIGIVKKQENGHLIGGLVCGFLGGLMGLLYFLFTVVFGLLLGIGLLADDAYLSNYEPDYSYYQEYESGWDELPPFADFFL